MKKNRSLITFLSLAACLILFFSSCYYDNMEDLYATRVTTNTNCDSVNVSFMGTISPKLSNSNCFACHGNAGPNLNFQDYTMFKNYVIIPSNKTKLFDSISIGHHSASFSSCELSQLNNWISIGTPQ